MQGKSVDVILYKQKSWVQLYWQGCNTSPVHRRCPAIERRRNVFGCFTGGPGSIPILGHTETPGYTRNTFLMPNIARTPDQHRSNSCRAPSLKPSSNSCLHSRLDYRHTSLSPAKICGTISCYKAESEAPPIWRHFFDCCCPGDDNWLTETFSVFHAYGENRKTAKFSIFLRSYYNKSVERRNTGC